MVLQSLDSRLVRYRDTVYKVKTKYDRKCHTSVVAFRPELDAVLKVLLHAQASVRVHKIQTEHFLVDCLVSPWPVYGKVAFRQRNQKLEAFRNAFELRVTLKVAPSGESESSRREECSPQRLNHHDHSNVRCSRKRKGDAVATSSSSDTSQEEASPTKRRSRQKTHSPDGNVSVSSSKRKPDACSSSGNSSQDEGSPGKRRSKRDTRRDRYKGETSVQSVRTVAASPTATVVRTRAKRSLEEGTAREEQRTVQLRSSRSREVSPAGRWTRSRDTKGKRVPSAKDSSRLKQTLTDVNSTTRTRGHQALLEEGGTKNSPRTKSRPQKVIKETVPKEGKAIDKGKVAEGNFSAGTTRARRALLEATGTKNSSQATSHSQRAKRTSRKEGKAMDKGHPATNSKEGNKIVIAMPRSQIVREVSGYSRDRSTIQQEELEEDMKLQQLAKTDTPPSESRPNQQVRRSPRKHRRSSSVLGAVFETLMTPVKRIFQ